MLDGEASAGICAVNVSEADCSGAGFTYDCPVTVVSESFEDLVSATCGAVGVIEDSIAGSIPGFARTLSSVGSVSLASPDTDDSMSASVEPETDDSTSVSKDPDGDDSMSASEDPDTDDSTSVGEDPDSDNSTSVSEGLDTDDPVAINCPLPKDSVSPVRAVGFV